jgi:ERCC4-related helicase
MLNRKRLGIFFDTGTGKTILSVQYIYNRLIHAAGRNVIIVTRASVVEQYQEAVEKIPLEIRERNNIVVCSYDLAYKYSHMQFYIVILDESHSAKNRESLRYSDLKKIMSDDTPYSFIMTATPQDKTKYEVICQFSLLYSKVLHPKGKTAFIKRYWIVDDYGNPKKEIPHRIGELNETINQMSISCIADDVLNIPPMKEPIILDIYKTADLTEFNTMLSKNVLFFDGAKFEGNNSGSCGCS